MKNNTFINKTMAREDLTSQQALIIIKELNELIIKLRAKGVKISTWYGSFDLDDEPLEPINRGYGYTPLDNAVDDRSFPWFLYWEIIWIVLNNQFQAGQHLLDLGGSSSLFSYYMASKGLHVTTVDLQQHLVDNGNLSAEIMDWNLRNYAMDMRELDFDFEFDHITSVCVFEHIPMFDRVEINKKIKAILKPGGHFSITFDYRNPSRLARINTAQDVQEQFIIPSGLAIRGNSKFHDDPKNYLLTPFFFKKLLFKYKLSCIRDKHFLFRDFFKTKDENDYTFGSLFLKKQVISTPLINPEH
jgi:2-polyprenyl-3-methyl-5-hydroxy-6-metoxy-1,4-benzoquinol methylase